MLRSVLANAEVERHPFFGEAMSAKQGVGNLLKFGACRHFKMSLGIRLEEHMKRCQLLRPKRIAYEAELQGRSF